MRTLLPTWTVRLLLIGIDAVFGSSGLQVIVTSPIAGNAYCASADRTTMRATEHHATIEVNRFGGLEYNIWRYIHSYHRRYGDTHYCPSLLPRPQFSIWPVGITVQVDFTAGPHGTCRKRRRILLKTASCFCISNGIKLSISTPTWGDQTTAGLRLSPPRRKLALTIPAAFPRVKMGFIIAKLRRILTLSTRLRWRLADRSPAPDIELALLSGDGPAHRHGCYATRRQDSASETPRAAHR